MPNVVRAFSHDSKVAVLDRQGRAILDWQPPRLKSNVPMVVTDIPPELKVGMSMKALHTFTVCFEDEGPWEDRPALEVLRTVLEYVTTRVLPRFTAFFQ